MYEYLAKVDRVVDGDTVDLIVDLGFFINTRMRVRLRGVDAPEVRGEERPEGLAATAFVQEQIPDGCRVIIRTYKVGKYGRYIADILYIPGDLQPSPGDLRERGVDLARALLEAGHAAVYE